MSELPPDKAPSTEIDTNRPHPARVYDYFLGGKDNFAADRALAEQTLAEMPGVPVMSRENRAFLGRAVRFLAKEAGIRQFLDIGTGLPTTGNVHEVAQSVAPESRVVYVDSDPLVIAHARALLTSSPEGRTAYVQADLRDPDVILSSPAVLETLDFTEPIALMLIAVLHYIPDHDKPERVIRTLLDALPAGSYLAASHITAEHNVKKVVGGALAYKSAGIRGKVRDSDEFAQLAFAGLDLVPPGVVLVSDWRRDSGGPRPSPAEVNYYGGVARKR